MWQTGRYLCPRATDWLTPRLSSSGCVICPGMASGRRPVVFSKLSKLLNQESALSAPCETAYAVISALRRRPRAAQECCAQARPVALDVTFPFAITDSSCRQALMLFRRLAADARSRAPVQGQAGPSWQDGAEVWKLTLTVVRFLRRVESGRGFFW